MEATMMDGTRLVRFVYRTASALAAVSGARRFAGASGRAHAGSGFSGVVAERLEGDGGDKGLPASGSADLDRRNGMNGYCRSREGFALYRLLSGTGGTRF